VLLPLLQRILRLKELPGREVQQVPAPLQSKRHRQALLLVLMPVLLPSGAEPHDLTQLLLFQK
jgi:ParB-like chromosome segregation protein Spo0J